VVITVRDHGRGGLWYLVAVHYPAALMARTAWERAERRLDLRDGDEGIGLYRLAPNPQAGTWASGLAGDRHAIVAVTLHEPTARKAQHVLRDGQSWMPAPDFADAMIYRRAKVVLDHAGETGRVLIRRPEGRGGSLTPDGDMREQVGRDD
jgi:hypothetical protein